MPAFEYEIEIRADRAALFALTQDYGRRLALSEMEFRERYVRVLEGEECLAGGPCPFLEGTLCTVYDDRPAVCRRYPCLDEGDLPPTTMLIEDAAVCPITFHVLEGLKRGLWREGAGECYRCQRSSMR